MPRPRLYFGPYNIPRYRIGQAVHCERFGDVEIVRTSNGRIPWPIGRRRGSRGRSSLVLYGDLAKAVQRETRVAVCYWWGCSGAAAQAVRRALDVPKMNEGASIRRQEVVQLPSVKAGRRKAWAKARDPERRRKIAEARRGKPRSPEVVATMRSRMLGTHPADSTRAKMSEAHRKRGTRPPWINPPWSAQDDEFVRTIPAKAAAERTGRTLSAVYNRRNVLQVPDGRRSR
jgi:hypothetical protein